MYVLLVFEKLGETDSSGSYFCLTLTKSLHKKCPNTVSPNTGKYVPEITPYLDTFHALSNFSQYSGQSQFMLRIK